MIKTELEKLTVVLAAVDDGDSKMTTDECLDELEELANTYGLTVVGRIIQKRENRHRAHYLGKGKVDELRELIQFTGASGVICDDELTGSQIKNLSALINSDVTDRTMLILDIFAERATSAEGKLQVELASLKYRMSHLVGFGKAMSRIGGGAGTHTRGAGETKLALDRRVIRERVSILDRQIKELQASRAVSRGRREKNRIPVVSLAGYTNAGKSTLLNRLTEAEVLAEDKLFATLDTTTRKLVLPNGSEALLTDTVGFIQKLPHMLIEAFRATLDEMRYADIILHVVDASNTVRTEQMAVVYETLDMLKCSEKPVILAFNKTDKDIELPLPNDARAEKTLSISALSGQGCEELLAAIEDVLKKRRTPINVLIPYSDGKIISFIHGSCEILSEEHCDDGTYFELYADEEGRNRLNQYVTNQL